MNQLMNIFLVLGFVFSLLWGSSAHAAMYKWVDDEGNVSYSQNPPPDRDAKYIPPPKSVDPPPATEDNNSVSNETGAEPGEEASNKSQTKSDVFAANCEAAKKNLEIYQTATQIMSPEKKVINLDEKMRAAKIKESQGQIDQFCK